MRKVFKLKLPGRIKNVELIEALPASSNDDFTYLSLFSLKVQNTYDDETKSPAYRYESVFRKWLDATVLLLTAEIDGKKCICLRTSIRPPLLLRQTVELNLSEEAPFFAILELPAGLIETEDRGFDGILNRASAETFEETGYSLKPGDFSLLGTAPFVSPGVLPERLFYVHAEVPDIGARSMPQGDGSCAEQGSDIMWVSLHKALNMCENGEIIDMKTELGIRRLLSNYSETENLKGK